MMDCLQNLLPTQIYDRLHRAGINTINQVLTLSTWDIRKLTNLNDQDVLLLRNLTVNSICPVVQRGYQLSFVETHSSTGSKTIDNLLHGGYRKGTLSEIYGESGSGKTQLALQSAIQNWETGCAYICTEDVFPVKRFQQIKQGIKNYDPAIDYGKNILIEHVTEPQELLACVTVRLPKLLESKSLSLIIIDSIAAPYRCDSTNYVQRAEDLREIAVRLLNLAQKYNLAVLCINQVTAAMETINECVPSLGLAWANMISSRIVIKKTNKVKENIIVRELETIFAPDLPHSKIEFIILSEGLIIV